MRARQYEHSRLEKQRKRVGLLRDYLQVKGKHIGHQNYADPYETEYNREFRRPPQSVYAAQRSGGHSRNEPLSSDPAKLIHSMETQEAIKRKIPPMGNYKQGPASSKRNRFSWIDDLQHQPTPQTDQYTGMSKYDQVSIFTDSAEEKIRPKSVSFATQT